MGIVNMKKFSIICIAIILSGICYSLPQEYGYGLPLKYITGYEIDLNNDNEPDIAMIIETSRGRELMALIKTAEGYNTFVLSEADSTMILLCQIGKTITETTAGTGHKASGKVYQTPGTYLELSEPEGASVAFFWNGSGFTEVWTAD